MKEYGDLIRDLKAKGAPKIDIDTAVVELKARKKKLEDTVSYFMLVTWYNFRKFLWLRKKPVLIA